MGTAVPTPAGSGAPAAGESQRDVPNTPSGNQGVPANPEPGKQESTQPVANPEAQRYAQEAAAHRARVKELEAQLKAHDDATMTASQKLERDYADAQAKTLEYEAELTRLRLETSAYRQSSKLGVGDGNMGAVLAIISSEHGHEVKAGADGTPENLADLVKQVLKDYPALAAQAAGNGQQPQRPGASSGGATNPGAGARTGTWTKQQIDTMSPEEYRANRSAILQAMARGEIR